MSSNNPMACQVNYYYLQPIESDTFNTVLKGVMRAGIVQGLKASVVGLSNIVLTPGHAWLESTEGLYVVSCAFTSTGTFAGIPGTRYLVIRYTYEQSATNIYPDFVFTNTLQKYDLLVATLVWGVNTEGTNYIVSVSSTNALMGMARLSNEQHELEAQVMSADKPTVLVSGGSFFNGDIAVDVPATELSWDTPTADTWVVLGVLASGQVVGRVGAVKPTFQGMYPIAELFLPANLTDVQVGNLKDVRPAHTSTSITPEALDISAVSKTFYVTSNNLSQFITAVDAVTQAMVLLPSGPYINGFNLRVVGQVILSDPGIVFYDTGVESGVVAQRGVMSSKAYGAQSFTPTAVKPYIVYRAGALTVVSTVQSSDVLVGAAVYEGDVLIGAYDTIRAFNVMSKFVPAVVFTSLTGDATTITLNYTVASVAKSLTLTIGTSGDLRFRNDVQLVLGTDYRDILLGVLSPNLSLDTAKGYTYHDWSNDTSQSFVSAYVREVSKRLTYDPPTNVLEASVPLRIEDTTPIKGMDDLANDPNTLMSSRKVYDLLAQKADAISANVLRGTAPIAGGYYGLTLGTPTPITISNTFNNPNETWTVKFKSNPFPVQRTLKAGLPIFIKIPVATNSATPTQFQFVIRPIKVSATNTETSLTTSNVTEEVYQAGRTDISASAVVLADTVGDAGDSVGLSVTVTRVSGTGPITLSMFIGDPAAQLYINFQTAVAAVQGYNYDPTADEINLSAKDVNIVSPIDGSKLSIVDGILGYPTFDPAKTAGYPKGALLWLIPPTFDVIDTGSRVYPYTIPASPTSWMGKEHVYLARTQFKRFPVLLRSTKDNNTDNFVENQMHVGMSWEVAQPDALCELGYSSNGDYQKKAGSSGYCLCVVSKDRIIGNSDRQFTLPIFVSSFVVDAVTNLASNWGLFPAVSENTVLFTSDVHTFISRTHNSTSNETSAVIRFYGSWYASSDSTTYEDVPTPPSSLPGGTYYYRNYLGVVGTTGTLSPNTDRVRVVSLHEKAVWATRFAHTTRVFYDVALENLELDIPNKNYYGFFFGVYPPPFMGATLQDTSASTAVNATLYYNKLNEEKNATISGTTNIFRTFLAPDGTKYTAIMASGSVGLDIAIAKFDPEWNPSAGKYWGFSKTPWGGGVVKMTAQEAFQKLGLDIGEYYLSEATPDGGTLIRNADGTGHFTKGLSTYHFSIEPPAYEEEYDANGVRIRARWFGKSSIGGTMTIAATNPAQGIKYIKL